VFDCCSTDKRRFLEERIVNCPRLPMKPSERIWKIVPVIVKLMIAVGGSAFLCPEVLPVVGHAAFASVPPHVSFMTRTIIGGSGLALTLTGILVASILGTKSTDSRQ